MSYTQPQKLRGFTLIELLTVIAIIGILSAILLPILAGAVNSAKKVKARTEIASLMTAIEAYDSAYSGRNFQNLSGSFQPVE
jgi:type IV pilus assembly protein PilA